MEGIKASVIILSQVFCEVRLEAQKFQLSKLWPLTLSETQQCPVYYHKRQNKAGKLHIWEAHTREIATDKLCATRLLN